MAATWFKSSSFSARVRLRRWDSLEETKFNTPSDFKISVLSLEISESVSDLGVWPVVLSDLTRDTQPPHIIPETSRRAGED